MTKNIAIVILLILAIAEGSYIFLYSNRSIAKYPMTDARLARLAPTGTAIRKPAFLTPGTKFVNNPLYAKAYQIFPGNLSANAKQALTGWDLKQTPQNDGSTQV